MSENKIATSKLEMYAEEKLPPLVTTDQFWDTEVHKRYVMRDMARELLASRKELKLLREVAESAVEHVCDYREVDCPVCEALKSLEESRGIR